MFLWTPALAVILAALHARPREYVVDFENAGENVAAYRLTVTVVTQTGIKANIDFQVPADTSAGLLRAAVRAALKDVKGIEVEPDGDDHLIVIGAKNERLLCVCFDATALQQVTGPKGSITLKLKMKADAK